MWEAFKAIFIWIGGKLKTGSQSAKRLDFESLNERSMALIDKLNESLDRAEEREETLEKKWQARAKEWDDREAGLMKRIREAEMRSARYDTERRADRARIKELEAEVTVLETAAKRRDAVIQSLEERLKRLEKEIDPKITMERPIPE